MHATEIPSVPLASAEKDRLIPLIELAKILPKRQTGRGEKRLAVEILIRWILKGHVPAIRSGGWFYVRRQDVAEWHRYATSFERKTTS